MIYKKKIVFIAFGNSIHTSKWINSINRDNFDIFIISTSIKLNKDQYKDVKFLNFTNIIKLIGILNFIKSWLSIYKIFELVINLILNFKPTIKCLYLNSNIINEIFNYLNPNLVHALEFQHNGYKLIGLNKNNFKNTKFIISNWGSDIFFYQKYYFHLYSIKKCLNFFDIYICETKRDIELYYKYGGKSVVKLIPGSVGVYKELIQNYKKEKIILIKGYNDKFGRCNFILKNLIKLEKTLSKYKIYIVLSNHKAKNFCKKYLKNLNITHLDKQNYIDTLSLISKSEIYIGASVSDGLSTMAIEALATGAKVIQGEASCLSEYNFKYFSFSFDDKLEDIIIRSLNTNFEKSMKINQSIIEKYFLYEENSFVINDLYKTQ